MGRVTALDVLELLGGIVHQNDRELLPLFDVAVRPEVPAFAVGRELGFTSWTR
jgi:hypothetical protein